MCKSKIHRATVTGADLNYVGSITIDPVLMEAADLLAHEQVHVVNVNNGARFETYAIPGIPGEGEICLNGAAARLAHAGDTVIIISYAQIDEVELAGYEPTVVFVDENNRRTEPQAKITIPLSREAAKHRGTEPEVIAQTARDTLRALNS